MRRRSSPTIRSAPMPPGSCWASCFGWPLNGCAVSVADPSGERTGNSGNHSRTIPRRIVPSGPFRDSCRTLEYFSSFTISGALSALSQSSRLARFQASVPRTAPRLGRTCGSDSRKGSRQRSDGAPLATLWHFLLARARTQVFPCSAGGEGAKKPLINDGFKNATTDEKSIR